MLNNKIIPAIVTLIGLYMVAMNIGNGFMIPPVLSGIAFSLLGVRSLLK